jgi:hypothetical protein
MKLIVVFYMALLVSFNQAMADDSPVVELSEAFLLDIMNGASHEKIAAYLEPGVLEIMGDNFLNLLTQIKSYVDRFGGLEEIVLLHNERLTSRLIRHVYIAHTGLLPVSYEVFLYKTDTDWKVTSVKFDSDMDVIFPALK